MADSKLRAAVRERRFVVAPGVFDLISAKIADGMGFDALYATGFGTVASTLGVADVGIATYSDMVSRFGQMAQSIKTPLIADADTGYGGLLNVRQTVRGYEAAGVTAIQIEDQEIAEEVRPYARPPGHSRRRDGAQDRGRNRSPAVATIS